MRITATDFMKPPEKFTQSFKQFDEDNNSNHHYDPNYIFEKRNDDNSSKSGLFYYLFFYPNKAFDCHGIYLHTNQNDGTFSTIKAETTPFRFNAFDKYEDGSYKGSKFGVADGQFFELIETKNVTAWGEKI